MTADDTDFRSDRVGTALAGTNPTVLRRLRAGFAVIGDVQHLPGYCVLTTDTPGVDQLTDPAHHPLGPEHDELRRELGEEIDRQR